MDLRESMIMSKRIWKGHLLDTGYWILDIEKKKKKDKISTGRKMTFMNQASGIQIKIDGWWKKIKHNGKKIKRE